MMRNRPWLVFALVFGWKVALLVFTAQPVPANDAFVYDGAVANLLLHGKYCNPSIIGGLPISATQVFSLYPPLYQVPLLAWMSVFGVSVLSAMALHLCLFGLYMLVLLAIFRRLQTPAWCVNLAGGFLLVITFHDRPDTFAHLLGMLAVYAWLRSRRVFAPEASDGRRAGWTWLMAVLVVLSISCSLQIGGTYLLWIGAGTMAACVAGGERFPLFPMLAMVLVPVLLVAMVRLAFPLLWRGFMENVNQTPFLEGLHRPYLADILKIVRTVPGVIMVGCFLPWSWYKQRKDFESPRGVQHEIVLVAALLCSLVVLLPSLFVLSSNTVMIIAYVQPVVVAAYLTVCAELFLGQRWLRLQVVSLLCLMLLGSVRAVGMSTWGVACARDVSRSAAIARVRHELQNEPAGSQVVLSSAYLYEAAHYTNFQWLHSDWLLPGRPGQLSPDLEGVLARKPVQLIVTQFDYYRRFQPVLEQLKLDPSVQDIRIENTAHVRAPDSYPSLQKVLQHISWAPVIVTLTWK